MKLKAFLVLSLIVFLAPVLAAAECNVKEDGDCCKQDSDCAAYFSNALCAVIALNKIEIKKLESQKAVSLEFCKGDIADKLQADAASKKAICLEEACEFEEDNG